MSTKVLKIVWVSIMDEITKQGQSLDESIEESQKDREYGEGIDSRSQRSRDSESNDKIKKNKINATSQQSRSAHSHSRSRSPHGTKNTTRQWMSSNAFINFVQDFRKNFAGTRSTRIFQMAGERWRNMSPEEKQPYLKAAMSIKNRRQTDHKLRNIQKLDTSPETPKDGDTQKEEKVGKKERKKREPKKTVRRKQKSDSDCDSMTSGTTASNTTDDLSDDSS